MKSRLPQLSYSNVIATIALFVALGGAAVAAGLPKNSVGTKQLKRGAVTAAKLKKGAVTAGKLGPKSVIAGKLGPSAVLPGNIGNGAVTTAKIGAGAVIASSIKNGVITTNKLNNKAVTTDKLAAGAVTNPILANGSVTPNKLSEEFGPIVSTLKTGQTLRGVFDLGGDISAHEGVSFPFALANPPAAPTANILKADATSTACPGVNAQQVPQAAGGQLCLYITGTSGAPLTSLTFDPASVSRYGFGLKALFESAVGEDSNVQGLWAVTAP
jgi:hypothetical protein